MKRGEPEPPLVGRQGGLCCSGQALIETCLVMGILCLVFMGFFQVSQWIANRQILHHAAARGARAKMVGFNRFMVDKSIRVATIPVAGRMLEPDHDVEDVRLREWLAMGSSRTQWEAAMRTTSPSVQHAIERARIPAYLGASDWGRARGILHYEHWPRLHASIPAMLPDGAPFDVQVRQSVDLRRLFGGRLHRAFYASDTLDLEGVSSLEAHYPLYIDDQNW